MERELDPVMKESLTTCLWSTLHHRYVLLASPTLMSLTTPPFSRSTTTAENWPQRRMHHLAVNRQVCDALLQTLSLNKCAPSPGDDGASVRPPVKSHGSDERRFHRALRGFQLTPSASLLKNVETRAQSSHQSPAMPLGIPPQHVLQHLATALQQQQPPPPPACGTQPNTAVALSSFLTESSALWSRLGSAFLNGWQQLVVGGSALDAAAGASRRVSPCGAPTGIHETHDVVSTVAGSGSTRGDALEPHSSSAMPPLHRTLFSWNVTSSILLWFYPLDEPERETTEEWRLIPREDVEAALYAIWHLHPPPLPLSQNSSAVKSIDEEVYGIQASSVPVHLTLDSSPEMPSPTRTGRTTVTVVSALSCIAASHPGATHQCRRLLQEVKEKQAKEVQLERRSPSAQLPESGFRATAPPQWTSVAYLRQTNQGSEEASGNGFAHSSLLSSQDGQRLDRLMRAAARIAVDSSLGAKPLPCHVNAVDSSSVSALETPPSGFDASRRTDVGFEAPFAGLLVLWMVPQPSPTSSRRRMEADREATLQQWWEDVFHEEWNAWIAENGEPSSPPRCVGNETFPFPMKRCRADDTRSEADDALDHQLRQLSKRYRRALRQSRNPHSRLEGGALPEACNHHNRKNGSTTDLFSSSRSCSVGASWKQVALNFAPCWKVQLVPLSTAECSETHEDESTLLLRLSTALQHGMKDLLERYASSSRD